jgi:hypothetical protein
MVQLVLDLSERLLRQETLARSMAATHVSRSSQTFSCEKEAWEVDKVAILVSIAPPGLG